MPQVLHSPTLPCLLLSGRLLRRVLTPMQERLLQRGIVSRMTTHLAERLDETLQIPQGLDAQRGLNQLA